MQLHCICWYLLGLSCNYSHISWNPRKHSMWYVVSLEFVRLSYRHEAPREGSRLWVSYTFYGGLYTVFWTAELSLITVKPFGVFVMFPLEKDIYGITKPHFSCWAPEKMLISFSDDVFLYSPLNPFTIYTIQKIMLMSPPPAREWPIKWHGIFLDCIDI